MPRAARCGIQPSKASTALAAQYSKRWRNDGLVLMLRDDRSLAATRFHVDVLISSCGRLPPEPEAFRPNAVSILFSRQGSHSNPFDAGFRYGDVHAITNALLAHSQGMPLLPARPSAPVFNRMEGFQPAEPAVRGDCLSLPLACLEQIAGVTCSGRARGDRTQAASAGFEPLPLRRRNW